MTNLVHDLEYMHTLVDVFENGVDCKSRNAVTRKKIGNYTRYDTRKGLPLLLSKKVFLSSVIKEIFWFNRGDTNIKTLGCGIWDKWADENGELGPIYSEQWVNQEFIKIAKVSEIEKYQNAGYSFFGTVMLSEEDILEKFGDIDLENETVCVTTVGVMNDSGDEEDSHLEYGFQLMRKKVNQLDEVINRLKQNPMDRRAIVCSWNNGDLDLQALPPCHVLYQFCAEPITSNKERREAYIDQRMTEMMARNNFMDNHESYSDAVMLARDLAEEEIYYASWYHDDPVNGKVIERTEEETLDHVGAPKYYLDCVMFQRSNDQAVGVPFNAPSYTIQLHLAAKTLGMIPRFLHHFQADVHIYEDQMEHVPQQIAQYQELLKEESEGKFFAYPQIAVLNKRDRIQDYTEEDLEINLFDYKNKHKPYVPYPVTE